MFHFLFIVFMVMTRDQYLHRVTEGLSALEDDPKNPVTLPWPPTSSIKIPSEPVRANGRQQLSGTLGSVPQGTGKGFKELRISVILTPVVAMIWANHPHAGLWRLRDDPPFIQTALDEYMDD